jgi:hypothetical protein
MGVTLDLRLIDHERLVVRGLRAVNDAIRHDDPEILRKYLTGLPVDVDSSIVGFRMERLCRLREVKAPEIIIRNEEHFLRLANGEAYRPEEFQNSTLDELRQLLGTWCWVTHCYSLDKAWDELHWFLEPMAGPDDFPLHPLRPNVGDPNLTVFAKALHGEVHYQTTLVIRSYVPSDLLSQVVRGIIHRKPPQSFWERCSAWNSLPGTTMFRSAASCIGEPVGIWRTRKSPWWKRNWRVPERCLLRWLPRTPTRQKKGTV